MGMIAGIHTTYQFHFRESYINFSLPVFTCATTEAYMRFWRCMVPSCRVYKHVYNRARRWLSIYDRRAIRSFLTASQCKLTYASNSSLSILISQTRQYRIMRARLYRGETTFTIDIIQPLPRFPPVVITYCG